MWLMPLRSLSNCDYELYNLPRLILGPIHPNQVMGTDPVSSHHGTRNSKSIYINPTYPYQSHNQNATTAHTCAPSPKQSTRDWIRIPGEIGWACPVRHSATVFCGSQAGGNVHKISLPLLKFRKNVTIRQVKFRQKFPSRLPHLSRPQPVRNGQ